jgi:hypothetical protein
VLLTQAYHRMDICKGLSESDDVLVEATRDRLEAGGHLRSQEPVLAGDVRRGVDGWCHSDPSHEPEEAWERTISAIL